MHAPHIDQYSFNLVDSPKKRSWPMILLLPVMGAAAIAGASFIMMIVSLIFTP